LGHCFSHNQQESKNNSRNIDDEVDSDTFAVEKCDISPYVLEKALAKSYEYEIVFSTYSLLFSSFGTITLTLFINIALSLVFS